MTLTAYLQTSRVKFDLDNLLNTARMVVKMNPHRRGYAPEEFAKWVVDMTNKDMDAPSYWDCAGIMVSTYLMDGETYPLRAKCSISTYTAETYLKEIEEERA